ncbi:MAG: hypothetical protein RBR84_08360 [Bacteroidales bacterium]|jgi:arsenate reductase-like glutaredoxin family protein|nr:hypothetical protein [Bacteroidales bacterium]MDD4086936.1 hypothetical protein [Bacteroidales bacterium]MDY0085911.1 hypothetical protein [Bacteroidales bacterium]
METIIIHTESSKAKALKQFLKAFGVTFTVEKHDKSPYDPAFVQKIKEQSESAKKGNAVVYDDSIRNELFGI